MVKKAEVDRQREHQANERTFLAWLRTSIALISFGLAIARFNLYIHQLQATVTQSQVATHPIFDSENLGVNLVVFGIIAIALAAWRYNQVFWQIERGDYRPNRLLVWLMTGVVIILGLLSLPLVLVRKYIPTSTPPDEGKRQSQNRHVLKVKGKSQPLNL